ncbi:unnamed protein product [Amoebophrya sp. A25]|nr:unnamed protein product [Amoebophrya sp. A25]|eukprot:GSA25T00011751001.1
MDPAELFGPAEERPRTRSHSMTHFSAYCKEKIEEAIQDLDARKKTVERMMSPEKKGRKLTKEEVRLLALHLSKPRGTLIPRSASQQQRRQKRRFRRSTKDGPIPVGMTRPGEELGFDRPAGVASVDLGDESDNEVGEMNDEEEYGAHPNDTYRKMGATGASPEPGGRSKADSSTKSNTTNKASSSTSAAAPPGVGKNKSPAVPGGVSRAGVVPATAPTSNFYGGSMDGGVHHLRTSRHERGKRHERKSPLEQILSGCLNDKDLRQMRTTGLTHPVVKLDPGLDPSKKAHDHEDGSSSDGGRPHWQELSETDESAEHAVSGGTDPRLRGGQKKQGERSKIRGGGATFGAQTSSLNLPREDHEQEELYSGRGGSNFEGRILPGEVGGEDQRDLLNRSKVEGQRNIRNRGSCFSGSTASSSSRTSSRAQSSRGGRRDYNYLEPTETIERMGFLHDQFGGGKVLLRDFALQEAKRMRKERRMREEALERVRRAEEQRMINPWEKALLERRARVTGENIDGSTHEGAAGGGDSEHSGKQEGRQIKGSYSPGKKRKGVPRPFAPNLELAEIRQRRALEQSSGTTRETRASPGRRKPG